MGILRIITTHTNPIKPVPIADKTKSPVIGVVFDPTSMSKNIIRNTNPGRERAISPIIPRTPPTMVSQKNLFWA